MDEEPVTYDKLKDYNVVIMMLPYRNYTDSEISAIKEYVKNGGGLFLIGSTFGVEDGGDNAIFNRIARSFGVDYAYSQTVEEPEINLGATYFIKVSDIRPNPINTNIKDLFLVTSTYIKIPGNSTPVAYSSSNSWADISYMTDQGISAGNTNQRC